MILNMKKSLFVASTFLFLQFHPAVHAQEKLLEEKIASIARTCINCHGSAQKPAQHIPPLHGQKSEYLLQRLRDFRAPDAKNHATVMPRLLGDLNDEQLQALAQWLEQNP